jgi:hypothetical protein
VSFGKNEQFMSIFLEAAVDNSLYHETPSAAILLIQVCLTILFLASVNLMQQPLLKSNESVTFLPGRMLIVFPVLCFGNEKTRQ